MWTSYQPTLGYARRDLDGLHRLNLDQWIWSRIETKGRGPERRSGHQACAIEKTLFVLGGWNASRQFDDLYTLDTICNPPVWSCIENSLSVPRWNFAACSVMAIPSWKIFAYGGIEGPVDSKNRQGIPHGEVSVLDTGLHRWSLPVVGGIDKPKPRTDTVLAYDSKFSRLILFGGWASEWLADVFTLDVARVVGPPYAIMDLYPNNGPVTGSTTLQITGIDFVNTKDVVVRFSSEHGTVDVRGDFCNSTQLVCLTPDFSLYQAGDVEVRIALNGDSFTTTSQIYRFFSVTSAQHSLIYGPGLISGGACNEATMFVIQARDNLNNNRTTGGDEFSLSIRLLGGGEDGGDLQLRSGVEISDRDDGTYHVIFNSPSAGSCLVDVVFLGTFGGSPGPVRGSGISVCFEEFVPRLNNTMTGKTVASSVQRDLDIVGKFIESVAQGINKNLNSDDWSEVQNQNAVVLVKEHLNMIQDQKPEIDFLIDRIDCILSYLQSQGINNGPLANTLQSYRLAWENSQREAPRIALKIGPLVKAQSMKTKDDIRLYEATVRDFLKRVESSPLQLYATGVDEAFSLLETLTSAYEEEDARCKGMIHLASIFECASDVESSVELVASAGATLTSYHGLWMGISECNAYIEEAGSLAWVDLNADGLEENARLILTKVKQQPTAIKGSDAYRGLERTAKQFLMTCPLIASLRQPAMRDRHWDELGIILGGQGNMLTKINKLSDILSSNIHKQAAAIAEITDKAAREAAQEEKLAGLSATWENVNFEILSSRQKNVPLLKITEENADQLEADQLALQTMIASRYDYFKPQAIVWQQALTAISDVTQMLSEIQRTWSYLEPLFIGSEEVSRELPEEAIRFAALDEQVRIILNGMSEICNIRQACGQKGLLQRLESINTDQEVCKKALADFLAGKRRVFPR